MDKRRKHFKKVGPRVYTLSWAQKCFDDKWSIARTQMESGETYCNRILNDGWEHCSKQIWTRSSMNTIKITFGNGLGLIQMLEHKL